MINFGGKDKMTISKNGNCDVCRTKNIPIQKELLMENEDDFHDRTNGIGNYNSDAEEISICQKCFVIPELDWDEDGDYEDLNRRNIIWLKGDWSVRADSRVDVGNLQVEIKYLKAEIEYVKRGIEGRL